MGFLRKRSGLLFLLILSNKINVGIFFAPTIVSRVRKGANDVWYNFGRVKEMQLQYSKNGRVNARVREIMEILTTVGRQEKQSDKNVSDEWSKARNYVYKNDSLDAQQVQSVVHFLQEVFPDNDELIKSVIQSIPRILRKNVQSFLRPTTEFLQDLYGMDLFHEAVMRNPSILLSRGVGYEQTADTCAIEDWITNSMGLSQSVLSKLKRRSPWIFQSPLARLKEVASFFDNILQNAGKSPAESQATIGKLLVAYPTLFNLSVSQSLVPRVKFLEESCGLTGEDIGSLLTGSRASIFCLSIEKNLVPTIDFLSTHLPKPEKDETKRHIRKCILSHPQVLGLSMENLKEKKTYFDAIDALGRAQRELSLISRVMIRSPSVLSLSLKENIVPTVEFLAGVWGKETPRICWFNGELQVNVADEVLGEDAVRRGSSLSSLLGEYPSILSFSLEGNIQPTLTFYNKTGFVRLDSSWKAIPAMIDFVDRGSNKEKTMLQSDFQVPIIRGRYIAASLFQRLLPRWHFYLVHKELLSKKNTNERLNVTLKVPPLHLLSVADDRAYCKQLGADVEDYKLFKEAAIPRLKFSSQFDTWLKTGRPIDV